VNKKLQLQKIENKNNERERIYQNRPKAGHVGEGEKEK